MPDDAVHGGGLESADHPSRSWGAGILAALAVGLVVFGVVLLGERSPSGGASDVAVPALPGEPGAGADQALDFALPLFDGTDFSLSRHLAEDGRPVFLNFWASWCPPCRAEMPDISEAAERYPDVLFLGVAVADSPDAAAAYAAEIDVSYPLGVDATGAIEAHYPSAGLPATFLISGNGAIVGTFVGQMRPAVIEELVEELRGR